MACAGLGLSGVDHGGDFGVRPGGQLPAGGGVPLRDHLQRRQPPLSLHQHPCSVSPFDAFRCCHDAAMQVKAARRLHCRAAPRLKCALSAAAQRSRDMCIPSTCSHHWHCCPQVYQGLMREASLFHVLVRVVELNPCSSQDMSVIVEYVLME